MANEQKVMRLKKEYIDAILSNPQLQGNIAAATNKKSTFTVYRWCLSNAEQLIMLSVLNCIKDFLSLPKNTVLTEMVAVEEVETIKA